MRRCVFMFFLCYIFVFLQVLCIMAVKTWNNWQITITWCQVNVLEYTQSINITFFMCLIEGSQSHQLVWWSAYYHFDCNNKNTTIDWYMRYTYVLYMYWVDYSLVSGPDMVAIFSRCCHFALLGICWNYRRLPCFHSQTQVKKRIYPK